MPVPAPERIVEVIADLGPATRTRYEYGSGCIVRGRTVVTAAHVVTDAVAVFVRRPDKKQLPARVILAAADPDLALLEIEDELIDVPGMGLGKVDRYTTAATSIPGCRAVGYPWFAETPSPHAVREVEQASGYIPLLTGLVGGLLTLQVDQSPQATRLVESQWQGMSGAPLMAADGCLLGVITEHATRKGPSAITAVPLTALESTPNAAEWWTRLGVTGPADLIQFPQRARRKPAYWATVREIHGRTAELAGRAEELTRITAFATGPGGYLWLAGEAWAGKTALVAEAISSGLPESVDVVAYFLSRRESDATGNRFLAAVIPQLAFLCDEDPPSPDRDAFRDLWARASELATGSGRHLLLVVDGLDEDLSPGNESVASMLPEQVDGSAHVLVTSRPFQEEFPDGLLYSNPLRHAPRAQLTPSPAARQLAVLAEGELHDLLHADDRDLAVRVLGVLAAAGGPLTIDDLVALAWDLRPRTPEHADQVLVFVTEKAARTLQPADDGQHRGYQFAHVALLDQARETPSLSDPDYRGRIDRWADQWRDAGWPAPAGAEGTTPRYLVDTYAATLRDQPQRLALLATDIGWVTAALQAVAVDRVLANFKQAESGGAMPADAQAMLAIVRSQAAALSPPAPLGQPGYVLRQLCLQAAEFNETVLAQAMRERLRTLPRDGLVPAWTTRRTSRALVQELGRHDDKIAALAVLPDGRVASSGAYDRRLRIWDPAAPRTGLVELAIDDGNVAALAALRDGRVALGCAIPLQALTLPDGSLMRPDDPLSQRGPSGGRVQLWNPAEPQASPVELGRHDGGVHALALLPDGRLASGNAGLQGWFRTPDGEPAATGNVFEARVRIWEVATQGAGPVASLGFDGYHPGYGSVATMAVLRDGRIATADGPGICVWDPAKPDAAPLELGDADAGAYANAVVALPDGRVVSGGGMDVSGGQTGRLRIWNPAGPGTGPAELGRAGSQVQALAALPDGRVVSGCIDRRLRIWNPAAPQTPPLDLGSHDSWVEALAVLPDGKVVSGGAEGKLLVWDPDAAVRGLFAAGPGAGAPGGDALLLPDGRVIYGQRGEVWDALAPDANPLDVGDNTSGVVGAVAVLPDRRAVVCFLDGVVTVSDAAPDSPGVDLGRHDGYAAAAAALPDGRAITGGSDGRVLLWNPAARDDGPAEIGRHASAVMAVAVLPDGRVAAGDEDGRLLVWNPGKPGGTPQECGLSCQYLSALAAADDGRVVAAGDADGRLWTWNPADPAASCTEVGRHGGYVRALAVAPGGRVISGGPQWIRVWDLGQATEIACAACSVAAIAISQPAAAAKPRRWRHHPRPAMTAEPRLLIAHEGQGISLWSMPR